MCRWISSCHCRRMLAGHTMSVAPQSAVTRAPVRAAAHRPHSYSPATQEKIVGFVLLHFISSHRASCQGVSEVKHTGKYKHGCRGPSYSKAASTDQHINPACSSFRSGGPGFRGHTWRAAAREANAGAVQPGAARIALHPQPGVAVRVRGAAHAVHPPLLIILAAWQP